MSTPQQIRIEDYDYNLPDERIALYPLVERASCRLLSYGPQGLSDHVFSDIIGLLPDNALMVCNNTRVINARLRFHKPSGALIEIFCLEPHAPADYALAFSTRGECEWQCLIGNSKKWKEGLLGMKVVSSTGETYLTVERLNRPPMPDKSQTVRFCWDNSDLSMADIIAAVGEIPIPPYLNRAGEDSDKTDYQTVYSRIDGSVAAPTAGLHFTPDLLDKIDARGIAIRELTLHVGAGTFRPVKSDNIGEHDMHSEFISVSARLIKELADALDSGRTVVAVGTTSVRTLESLYHAGRLMLEDRWHGEVPQWTPYENGSNYTAGEALRAILNELDKDKTDTFTARTRIIIAPGYRFRVVGAMVTNFHQPRSTLLLLVSAFIGDAWREVYKHALAEGYRFLSYGDACYFTPTV